MNLHRTHTLQALPGATGGRTARRAAQAALAACALLGACASSPPLRYHALEAVAPAGVGSAGAPGMATGDDAVLQVGAVQVPPALDRQELVRETAPGQFEIREFDHWAAPLGRLARQALAEDLAARLPPDRVTFPGAPWPVADALLTVDILSFRVAGGVATMVASWSVRRPVPATPGAPAEPARRGAQWRLETPAGDDAASTARAFSALLAQLADRIAATRLAG